MFVDVDTEDVQRMIERAAKSVDITVADVLYDQAALAGEDLIKLTPPSKKLAGKKGVSDMAIGKASVSSDLAKAFGVIPQGAVSWERNGRTYYRNGDAVWSVSQSLSKPRASVDEMAKHHHKLRSTRGSKAGRVGGARGELRADAMMVKQSKYRAYKRAVLKRVGRMKAGWIAGVIAASTKTNRKTQYPKALDKVRALVGNEGGWVDAAHAPQPYVEIYNSVPYFPAELEQRLEEYASANRKRDIAKNMRKRLDKLAARINAGDSPTKAAA